MKTLLLVVGLVVGLAGSAGAAEIKDLQRAVGGFRTTGGVVVGSAQEVTGVLVDCTGTACVAALYDGDGFDDATNANGRFETGAAASASSYIDLSDAPIRFTTGVLVGMDANVRAVVIYTQQSTP